MSSRRYTAADLQGLSRADLGKLVAVQAELWPEFCSNTKTQEIHRRLLAKDSSFSVQTGTRDGSRSPLTPLPDEFKGEEYDITLYVVDHSNSRNRMETLHVHVDIRCEEDIEKQFVDGREVIERLQETMSAVYGDACFSVASIPTGLLPGVQFYTPFLTIQGSEMKIVGKSTELLLTNLTLLISVESIISQDSGSGTNLPAASTSSLSKSRELLNTGLESSGLTPLDFVKQTAEGRKERKDELSADHIEWVKREIAKRPGYDVFIQSKRRTLQNKDIPEYWNFALLCLQELSGTQSTDTNRKVLKKDVQIALNLPASWFTDARKGQDLLAIYGHGGTKESRAVVKELDTVRIHATGWTALLKFLKKHDKKQSRRK